MASTKMSQTGYGPSISSRNLIFDGDEEKYELWEVKFLAHLRLQKLHDVLDAQENSEGFNDKNANVFAELVQRLDDKSLALIIREAKDNGKKALEILREHYLGKSRPRIISLYTELTSLKKQDGTTSPTTSYARRELLLL